MFKIIWGGNAIEVNKAKIYGLNSNVYRVEKASNESHMNNLIFDPGRLNKICKFV